MQRGYSLLELLIVIMTVMVLIAIAIPLLSDALLRGNIASIATDAKAVYVAMQQYHIDNSNYPDDASFDIATFEPLTGQGYYSGRAPSRLANDQADGYGAPDDSGPNQEFWLEMTLGVDRSVRFLVADSDNAPLGGGDYYDGIYLFLNGNLTPIYRANE